MEIIALRAFIAVVVAFVGSDLLKRCTSRSWRPFQLGGMPSTHAALVASLTTAVWFETGFSALFLACAVFSALVVRDACGVRLEVTRHSAALNRLTRSRGFEITGHTPLQALAGAAFGVLVATIVYLV